jgi:hypothetical protein
MIKNTIVKNFIYFFESKKPMINSLISLILKPINNHFPFSKGLLVKLTKFELFENPE